MTRAQIFSEFQTIYERGSDQRSAIPIESGNAKIPRIETRISPSPKEKQIERHSTDTVKSRPSQRLPSGQKNEKRIGAFCIEEMAIST